ncbi:unnamed protein product [Protopolystoma xenopodis]|uniref:Myosin VI lever arm domain-containing protein n=1 Tax=Protopolystoma xenopodis TaxID=117903 RepID=A0A3S5A1E7_9PLAT|nr:unnamed protein product [Protopolystoma xenopodis]
MGLNNIDFKFGVSRVFFRPGKFAEFDQMLRSDPQHLASLVAKVAKWLIRYRWHLAQYCAWEVIKLRKKIEYRRAKVILLQRYIRGWLCRRRLGLTIKAMLEITRMRRQLESCLIAYQKMPKYRQEGDNEVRVYSAVLSHNTYRLVIVYDEYCF